MDSHGTAAGSKDATVRSLAAAADGEGSQSAAAGLRFDILTIFPRFFDSVLSYGVVSRALRSGVASVVTTDLREFTTDRHRTVDDRPFGGGEGMVMKPEPIFRAAASLGVAAKAERDLSRESVILLSAQGEPFTQLVAHELAGMSRIVLLCGRYEGVDERVAQHLCDRELSVGDYVLSGGELAAAVVVDAVVRLMPGVLGNADSAHYESFGAAGHSAQASDEVPTAVAAAAGLLDYPHYTRPAEFDGAAVPDVLLNGDHAEIREWRRERALEKTLRNRPDLLEKGSLTPEDAKRLQRLRRTFAGPSE